MSNTSKRHSSRKVRSALIIVIIVAMVITTVLPAFAGLAL